MKNVLFIAWQDARYQLRQGSALIWMFVMPPVFFYFLGTVTQGASASFSGGVATPLVVAAEAPGFLRDQLDLRLRDNDFEPDWQTRIVPAADGNLPPRVLTFEPRLTERIVAGEVVGARYDTRTSALAREYEKVRIYRSLYTALADIVTADARSPAALTPAQLVELNGETRVWQLAVSTAGQRREIPTGFEHIIPGILVMFTLLVLLTTGSAMLHAEREQGLLRRLASAPITRGEVVAGKWGGRMVLAALQVGSAVLIGTLLFRMHWGPDAGMVVLVLATWASFCASAGLLLGSVALTGAQAAGTGVLAANVLAALGGCWWPIEITPPWMQALQKAMPTGWAMDALHKLISFEAGALAAMPQVVALLAGTLVVGALAVNRFRYA